MPCWGPWASGRAPGLSRGRGVLASDARSKWVRWQARITAVAARFSLPFDRGLSPAFPSGSEWQAQCTAGAFYTALPRLLPGFLLPSFPVPAQPVPPSVRSPSPRHSHTSVSQISKHTWPLGLRYPGADPPESSLGDQN
ncbi:unnamed protein product [Gulo gulo]|uniref:Uncharacterized protein n=1 Tax=Gulo gulo TaxID=48420 RepID=A0A9X9LUK2_GULGU|nr:unnamed protein product [Gulo gulo]